jgi:hypothetical protein
VRIGDAVEWRGLWCRVVMVCEAKPEWVLLRLPSGHHARVKMEDLT